MNRDISNIRREYDSDELNEANLEENPLILFQKWLDLAIKSENKEPTAMVLSTFDVNNEYPSSRIVLLKGISKGKFQFFTNYYSEKAKEIDKNASVSLNFYWPELDKQVRIKGYCSRTTTEVSDEYYNSRPIDSKIGAWVSHQSSPLKNREVMEEQFEAMSKKFEGEKITRPDYWGGFEVVPSCFEFWQGRTSRLHDRFEYQLKQNNSWEITRLYP